MRMCLDSSCSWSIRHCSGLVGVLVSIFWALVFSWPWRLLGGCLPSPVPSLFFSTVYQCDGCLFLLSFLVGAHGWVAWICQPWERSPSRSWLPIVEAPGCLRHPTSALRGSRYLQLGIGLIVMKGKPAKLLWPMKGNVEKSWLVFRESTSLLAKVFHEFEDAEWEDGETSASFRRVSYPACAGISLTTSDVFLPWETFHRTGLWVKVKLKRGCVADHQSLLV